MKTICSAQSANSLAALGAPPEAYQRLQAELAQTSWICQGTVVCRTLVRQVQGRKVKKGPYYMWTSKVEGKTVCVALSQTQYQVVAEAIENSRRLQKLVEQMQAMSLKTIFKNVPGVTKRK